MIRAVVLNGVADGIVDHAAGTAVGVSLHGKQTVVASGIAETRTAIAVTVETQFDLASVTKIVATTAALMVLVSSGDVNLDTRVVAVIPSFAGSTDSTIRDLLQHRAGLWEWQPLYLAASFNDGPNAVIDSIPPRYRPGTERHYSDLGFIYLGRVIEAATGLRLADACSQLVFEPLGMRDTGFCPSSGAATTALRVAASGHGDRTERAMIASGEPYPVLWPDVAERAARFGWREHEIRGEANDGNCFHAFGGVAGHAGLFSTVDDLLTVADAFGGSGETDTPWRASVAEEFFAAGPDAEQALGFRRTPILLNGQAHTLLWHPGFTGCAVGFVPGAGLSIALASNRLLTSAPATPPTPTTQLWQPLVAAAARLYTQHPTSSRTS